MDRWVDDCCLKPTDHPQVSYAIPTDQRTETRPRSIQIDPTPHMTSQHRSHTTVRIHTIYYIVCSCNCVRPSVLSTDDSAPCGVGWMSGRKTLFAAQNAIARRCRLTCVAIATSSKRVNIQWAIKLELMEYNPESVNPFSDTNFKNHHQQSVDMANNQASAPIPISLPAGNSFVSILLAVPAIVRLGQCISPFDPTEIDSKTTDCWM